MPVPDEPPCEQLMASNQLSFPSNPVPSEPDSPSMAHEAFTTEGQQNALPAEIAPAYRLQVSHDINNLDSLLKKDTEHKKSILIIKNISIMLAIVDIALLICLS